MEQMSVEERLKLACNSNTPSETLTELALDTNLAVRLAVLRNKKTTDETVYRMRTDFSEEVKSEAVAVYRARIK